MIDTASMVRFTADELSRLADAERASAMAAYMKTEMPFYGVPKSGRTPILRRLLARFPVEDRAGYRRAVTALWERPHREEKYLAIGFARSYPGYTTLASVPLYRRIITQGAWWDLVDETAIHLVGAVLGRQRDAMAPRVQAWNDDADLWLRRTSIICQVGRKEATDRSLLFDLCTARLHEPDFFIRKAIGWALRDYARTDPSAVLEYALAHRSEMSGLSFREATKHLNLP